RRKPAFLLCAVRQVAPQADRVLEGLLVRRAVAANRYPGTEREDQNGCRDDQLPLTHRRSLGVVGERRATRAARQWSGRSLSSVGLVVGAFARGRVEEQLVGVAVTEVEHVGQRAREGVEGLVTDASQAPVVLDEAQDRRLIRDGAVHEV